MTLSRKQRRSLDSVPTTPPARGEPPSPRRSPLAFAVFLVLVVGTAAYHHLRIRNIPDLDSFYHLTHAALYRRDGLLMTGCRWMQDSVIDRYASDIWYGFHLFLVPFTTIADPVLRIKLPGVVLTSGLLVAFWWAVARLGLSRSYFWPFLLLFNSPVVIFHFIMTRPHVISIGLSALLFSFVVEGSWPAVLAASAGIAFFHLSFFWMVPVIVLSVELARLVLERRLGWPKLLAALVGLAAGWLARPNPIGAARILWVQIFELVAVKQAGVPLAFARELAPITGRILVQNFAVFLVFWGVAAALAVAALLGRAGRPAEPRERLILASSLLLSAGFFGMMLFVARRSYDPWSIFVVILVACAHDLFFGRRGPITEGRSAPPARGGIRSAARGRSREGILEILIPFAGGTAFIFLVVFSSYHNAVDTRLGTDAREYREAAVWIETHSAPDDIVYNVAWDSFPRLFFWNQKNLYVGGMDPIFQYAFDPSLYWKSHWLLMGKMTRFMCSNAACTPDTYEDTWTVLRRDFRASWLFLEKRRSPVLYAWLKRDPRFVPVFENARHAVYDLRAGGFAR